MKSCRMFLSLWLWLGSQWLYIMRTGILIKEDKSVLSSFCSSHMVDKFQYGNSIQREKLENCERIDHTNSITTPLGWPSFPFFDECISFLTEYCYIFNPNFDIYSLYMYMYNFCLYYNLLFLISFSSVI